MKTCLLWLTLTMFSCQALAVVEPVTIITGRGDGIPTGTLSSYVVPAGKVLILDSVQYIDTVGPQPTDLIVQVTERPLNLSQSMNVFIQLTSAYSRWVLYPFPVPVRLYAGSSLQSNRIRGYYVWRGQLVDTADLFAKLEVELKNPRLEGGQLVADTKVASSRPHRLTVESSVELPAFVQDTSATVTVGPNNAERAVGVDLDGGSQKFLRVSATARPTSLVTGVR
jgi:hypothetical protein